MSPICLITSIITDRIGQDKVLLLINHNYNKFCDVLAFFKVKIQEIPRVFLLAVEKKGHLSKLEQWCILSSYTGIQAWLVLSYYTVLLVLKSGHLVANQIWEFCCSYD